MAGFVYRGYDVKLGGFTGNRYYIYKDGKEVYSMTATEEQVQDWIDKEKRRQTKIENM